MEEEVERSGEDGWRRRCAGRRIADGARGDSVDFAARERVVRARVWEERY